MIHKTELAEIEAKRLAEVKAVEDAEKQAKLEEEANQKNYKQFLADNNYNQDTDILNTDILSPDNGKVKLYRLVATYTK